MKKLLLFLASFLISISVLSKEISLVCETKGQAYFPNSESINLVSNDVYYFDEEKQSLKVESNISLCNLYKQKDVVSEVLSDKKNIYYKCTVAKHEESIKINRVSGEITTFTSDILSDGKSYQSLKGFCKKANAKF